MIGLSVIVATPLCIKPAKDGLSDLLFPKKDANEQEPFWRHAIFVISNFETQSFTKKFIVTIYTGVVIGIVSSSMQDIINILGSSFFTIVIFYSLAKSLNHLKRFVSLCHQCFILNYPLIQSFGVIKLFAGSCLACSLSLLFGVLARVSLKPLVKNK